MLLVDFILIYCRTARQLAARDIAEQWFALGTPVAEAIEWANLGYLPGEVGASGMTLAEAHKAERRAAREAGRPMNRAMKVIRQDR